MTNASASSAQSAVPSGASAKPPQPTEFPPAVRQTVIWLQNQFTKAYKQVPPPMPDRFTRREFGYILWPDKPGPPPFVRHRAFASGEDLQRFLARGAPHSLYYSTAYYRRPAELKMLDKQWLGAELIFDLDADHLADVEKAKAEGHELPLEEQLRQVKVQFKRLLDEFLFGDFGLGEKDVWITFSGGRGYHAHVVEDRLMQLESRGRREVVDYITGKFPAERGKETPDLSWLITEKVVHAEGRGKFVKKTTQETMAPADSPGWPGRITRTLVTTLRTNVVEADRKAAKAWLTGLEGVGAGGADKFLERFDARALDRVAAGYVDQGVVVRRVVHHVLQQATLPFAKGETDEPVTADTKRLIRLPGSLHGKTGLRCAILNRSDLDAFDPLRDAVAFGSDPVTIHPRKDAEATLGGERVAVKAGAPVEVPERHAVFWLARQGGTIVLPSGPANR
jgi:DNA primase small subunit